MKSIIYPFKIIDWIYILINVTFNLSIIPSFFFDVLPIPPVIGLVFFSSIIFIIRWKTKFTCFSLFRRSLLILLFFLIYIADCAQNMVLNPIAGFQRIFYIVNIILFFSYLINLIDKDKDVDSNAINICKPYMYYCCYNAITIVIAGFLILYGIIAYDSIELPATSLTRSNVEDSGHFYYFPGYLSVAMGSSRILGMFGMTTNLTGLSHEPHVINYLIIPTVFLLLSLERQKFLKYSVLLFFIISLFFAFSTTTIIILGMIFFIDSIWAFVINKRKSALFSIAFIIILLVVLYNSIFYELFQNAVIRKTIDNPGSIDYSSEMLKYIITPSSLFGYGNLPSSPEILKTSSIGLISSFLDVSFYALLLFSTFKIVMSPIRQRHFIGLACLYMIIHSLKVNLLAFFYPYTAFIVFIVYYMNSNVNGSKKKGISGLNIYKRTELCQ